MTVTEQAPAPPIKARATRFDLSDTPLHFVPGDAQTSAMMNVLQVVLPPGERWFCDVYRDALPLVTEAKLREEMRGFVAQEATHAKAHHKALSYLAERGVDVNREVELADRVRLAARRHRNRLPAPIMRRVLLAELAAIAAIEHFTGVLGHWILNAGTLDEIGTDPVMLDLFRWHGAEEVEHRAVAFDVYRHLGGGHRRRVLAMYLAALGLTLGWVAVTSRLLALDPARPGHFSVRAFRQAGQAGRLPTYRELRRTTRNYMKRSYHPLQVGSTEQALAYLASSPGVNSSKRGTR